jgi:hypothetical protein
MSDDLKQKLWTAAITAAVSALMALGGVEKSEHDTAANTNGHSWIATDLQQHTIRENQLQNEVDDLRDEVKQLKKESK